MIKKFEDFDVQEYLDKKKQISEAVDVADDERKESVDLTEDDVITGQAVYDNPYLSKITNIILKKLKRSGLGDFGVYHDVVYINGIPGVWIYSNDDETKNIVCCRDTNVKILSMFNHFDINASNKGVTTYSTQKLGFKDMIDQMVYDLTPHNVNEGILNEAVRYGDGWTADSVVRFEKLTPADRDYVYDFVRKSGKGKAISDYFDLIVGNDPTAVKVMKVFVGGEPVKTADSQARYLMSLADSIVNLATGGKTAGSVKKAADSGILDNLISEYKGAGPAIKTSADDDYDVVDDDDTLTAIAAREEAKKEAIKEDTIKYEKTLHKLRIMTNAMCHYVKQNGKLDDDDASAMIKRGLFLTGKGGIGKSYTVKQVLDENHMVLNRDYVNVSSGSTTAESVYNYLYQYNGKLIIFDDSPDLFSTAKKVAMWKAALQTEGTDSLVSYPLTSKDDTKGLYKTGTLTRQERYFKEMGRKSLTEKSEYRDKRLKELRNELGTGYDKSSAELIIADEWKEIEAETVPLMPNNFVFDGAVIVIGNDPREEMRKQVGEQQWSAIVDRFQDYDLVPMSESVWEVIKKKIMDEYGNGSIPDAMCTIQRSMTEEFVEEVDKLIVQPQYKIMTWRVIQAYGRKLRGKYGLEDWKEDLKNDMNTNK